MARRATLLVLTYASLAFQTTVRRGVYRGMNARHASAGRPEGAERRLAGAAPDGTVYSAVLDGLLRGGRAGVE